MDQKAFVMDLYDQDPSQSKGMTADNQHRVCLLLYELFL